MSIYTPDPADVELVAEATEAHHIVSDRTDAMGNSPCVCDQWWDSADEPGWDEHMAEVTLSALAAAGRLRRNGGVMLPFNPPSVAASPLIGTTQSPQVRYVPVPYDPRTGRPL